MSSRTVDAPRARRGFTLVELLVSMMMIAVLGTAIVSIFNTQQRFVRAASTVGAQRAQMQTALAVLPADLRGISPVGGDIISMSDSSIHVRSTIATSIVCTFVAPTTVTLAPQGLVPGTNTRFTTVVMTPQVGDSLFIWDEGVGGGASDDTWVSLTGVPYAITGIVSTPGACSAPYTTSANATAPAYVVELDPTTPLLVSLQAGAAVRVTRNVRYGLYKASADNQWYLGYQDPDSSFTTYQFVAGPFRNYAGGSEQTGIKFRYFSSTGVEIVDYNLTAAVARIEITARTHSKAPISLGGAASGKAYRDSLRIGVTLRNRNN